MVREVEEMEDGQLHCALPCASESNTVQAIVEAHRGLGNPTEVWCGCALCVGCYQSNACWRDTNGQGPNTTCSPKPYRLSTSMNSDTRQATGAMVRRAKGMCR